jgi:hypothetical protein
MKVKIWLASIFAITITTAAWGQQGPVPKPVAPQPVAPKPAAPKPAASAQSLPVTMQEIQTELNKVGKLNFVIDFSNAEEKGTSNVIEEDGKVVADPDSCSIRYHTWKSIHGEVVNDEDVLLSMRDVKGVWTMASDELWKKVMEKEGTTNEARKYGYYERYSPTMYVIAMRMANDDEYGFPFTDQKQAQSVGKAMARAVKLCGGKLEPY